VQLLCSELELLCERCGVGAASVVAHNAAGGSAKNLVLASTRFSLSRCTIRANQKFIRAPVRFDFLATARHNGDKTEVIDTYYCLLYQDAWRLFSWILSGSIYLLSWSDITPRVTLFISSLILRAHRYSTLVTHRFLPTPTQHLHFLERGRPYLRIPCAFDQAQPPYDRVRFCCGLRELG
jgi:hypothetical protein